MYPSSTGKTASVIQRDASDARKTAICATSSTLPIHLIGYFFEASLDVSSPSKGKSLLPFMRCSYLLANRGVLIADGQIALIRIPRL